MLVPLTVVCLATAAHTYAIPQQYLYAILAVEGGQVGREVPDRNGSRDLGPFQINTSWGPAIARFWGIPVDKALVRVRDDGCANAVVAAAILKQCSVEAHDDFHKAVGLYHSHTGPLAERYRARAFAALAALGYPVGQ
jgi:hypothetical protein